MKNIKFTTMRTELAPNQVRKFAHDEYPDASLEDYAALGFSIAEDAEPVLSQTGFTPLQYLQYPLNKPIEVLTTPTVADKICGRSIPNIPWEAEEVIQPVVEGAGVPQLYGDDNDTPLASFNADFERRTNVRFELGIRVGKLEDARIAAMGVLGFKSPYDQKRGWMARSFQLLLDQIAFRGFCNAAGQTYGLLTDPAINASSVATKDGQTLWKNKNYQAICADIREMFTALTEQTDTHFNGLEGDKCKLVLAPEAYNALATQNDFGKSVKEFISENYTGCEVIVAPRLRGAASGGTDMALLIADELDGTEVVSQFVTTQMRLLGVFKGEKHVKEAYTCSTAGVMYKQPLGVVARFGL